MSLNNKDMAKIEEEDWKPIPGFPNYQISRSGIVKSFLKSKPAFVKPVLGVTGYLRVNLRVNGKIIIRPLHRLLMTAFVGPSKLHVNHKDFNKLNNSLDNLEYLTPRENTIHYNERRPNKKYPVGVRKEDNNGRTREFIAIITIDKKPTYLGSFLTAEEAGRAYQEARIKRKVIEQVQVSPHPRQG